MRTASQYKLFLTGLSGLLLSFFLGWVLFTEENHAIQKDFRNDVNDKVSALQLELALNIEAVHALKGLYESSTEVTFNEFNKLTRYQLDRHQSIRALEWVPRVPQAERAAFEQSARQHYPDFEIAEPGPQGSMIRAQQRPVYYPVYFLAPLTGNKSVLGLDLFFESQRQQALQSAIDTGRPLATPSLTLVQKSRNKQGFLVVIPIYKGSPSTLKKRREKLKGLVVGVFRTHDILSQALRRTTASGINLTLLDNSTDTPQILVESEIKAEQQQASPFRYEKSFPAVVGRTWSVIATPDNHYIADRRSALPYIATLVGLLLTFLVTLVSSVNIRRTELISLRTRELNEAKNKLEILTRTDPLTGAANRRHLEEYIQSEWNHALRDHSKLSLIMLDIDFFKGFNDHYGHLAGDECLKQVASTLQRSLHRVTDLLARYGGEEFAIVLPMTQNPEVLAERCRQSIEKLKIPNIASSVSNYVTISVGVATVVPNQQINYQIFENYADRALYKAKNEGRNQVVISDETPPAPA